MPVISWTTIDKPLTPPTTNLFGTKKTELSSQFVKVDVLLVQVLLLKSLNNKLKTHFGEFFLTKNLIYSIIIIGEV